MGDTERNRGAACFHAFVAVFLLLAGGALIGLGVWLRVGAAGGLPRLSFAGAGLPGVMRWTFIATVSAGGFMVVAAMVSLCALARNIAGPLFRAVYVLMALMIVCALVVVAGGSFFVLNRREAPVVGSALADAWRRTVADRPIAVCAVEAKLECRGFRDKSCKRETCAKCGEAKGKRERTCFDAIIDDLRMVYLPAGIVSVVIGAFVLADIFITCAL